MASAEALVMISLGSSDYAPGEIIHGLTPADLEDLKGFVRELTDGEAVEVPEGFLLAVKGDGPHEVADPAREVPGVDSGMIVENDPIHRASGVPLVPADPLGSMFPAVPGDTVVEADESEGTDEGSDEEPTDRIGDVKAAIDLLEEDDFTAAGRPKIGPLTKVLGFKPDAEEVTAALALREAEGQ